MKRNRWKLLTLLIAAVVLITTLTLSVYAYFSTRIYVYTEDGREVAHLGMNLQLLFGKLDESLLGEEIPIPYYRVDESSGKNVFEDPDSETYTKITYDMNQPWGSPQNPYIIANERHLQNLSALQSIGYFDLMYISKNFTNGTYNNGISMPYFLVCTEEGTPTVINASEIGTIKPVGSAEHPFIGVVGGAFVTGETYIDANGDKAKNEGEKTTTVSAFHNVKVQTTTDQTDVGLFGYVGYLGTEPDPNNADDLVQVIGPDGTPLTGNDGNPVMTVKTTFEGVVSILENFTLSDVQIKVERPGILEDVSEFFASILGANHNFTYTAAGDTANMPHENHHIGILAGHVSYASVEYISVYYSDGTICAIDLLHTEAGEDGKIPNYHSTTGILGFMHNMNSSVTNQGDSTNGYTGNCLVSVGGTSSGGLTLVPDGAGTGGGQEIGLGRGYVMAKTLYEGFHYVATNQALGDRVWRYMDGSTPVYAMMFFQNPGSNPATYVDQNGQAVTISNGVATVSGVSYSSYILRNIASGTGTDDDPYVYAYTAYINGSTVQLTAAQVNTLTEIDQTIWQVAKEKPAGDNTPAWVDAVLVVETVTGGQYSYALEDGTPVELVAQNGQTGFYSAALTNAAIRSDGSKASISAVFFRRSVNGAYVYSITPQTITPPAVFQEKPLQIAYAKTMNGTNLCIESTEGLSLGSGQEGNFYFYDGVFTFALSSKDDTIEDVWENDTPDEIVLGPSDASQWQQGPYKDDYFSVAAFLTKIESLEDLNKAIDNNKEIFIGYYTPGTGGSWQGGSLSAMSLNESDRGTSRWGRQNDAVSAASNYKQFFTAEERTALLNALSDNATENQDIIDLINKSTTQILNLESAKDLKELQDRFRITPDNEEGVGPYTFTGTTSGYELGLLRRYYNGAIIEDEGYSIWSGIDGEFPAKPTIYIFPFGDIELNYKNTFTTAATLTDNGDGTFKIHYENPDTQVGRYIYYDTGDDVFKGQETAGNYSNLCFYVIEKMTPIATGSVVYNPVEDEEGANVIHRLPGDQYILWPNAVMTQDGTMVNGTLDPSLPHDAGDIVTDDTNATGDVYKTYYLRALADLIAGDNGWQNGRGGKLTQVELRKKFTMQEAMDFAISLKIPNIPNIQINNNTVLAPVGPGGAMANIPTGSIAFRINKAGESTIRVIVAVPTSVFYDGTVLDDPKDQLKVLSTDVDYYLGLWKTEDLQDGEWNLTTFSQTSAEQKFELPRSRPYSPDSTVANADYILVKYGNETYRCYLNGDKILVGYEFTVTEAGTYILGTAAGSAPFLGIFGRDTSVDYPMEIVYCSADGTASPGRDGTSTSAYGSIDYVYDYGNTIVHVQDYETSLPATENYQYYYSSHVITYTDNELKNGNTFVSINDLQIYVQRKIDTGQNSSGTQTSHSAIYVNVKSPLAGEFTCKTAGVETDDIHVSHTEQTRTTTN